MTINRRAMTEAEELFSASRTLQQLVSGKLFLLYAPG
jgi:hypothetical protein